MKSLNMVQLIGNVGADPEMRFSASGKAITTFNLATNRKYKANDNEQIEETTWHRIVVWERLAELCNQSINKGDPVYIQGRIRNSNWEDDVGVKHYSTEIVASSVIFLGRLNGKNQAEKAELVGLVEEDIPF